MGIKPFPWILQRYIMREMGKTFLLTSLALTGMLGFGGGVLNMIELGDVTPGQLFQLLALMLPMAAALTLPMAALFSATATYGKLSADNEFVACRSSGINLHVLFAPTLVLSLLAASVTFGFYSFVIPRMIKSLDQFGGADIGALVQSRIHRSQGISLGQNFRVYARDCIVDPKDKQHIALTSVAYLELDHHKWKRFGTARTVDLRFERSATSIRVAGQLIGLSYYDRDEQQFGSTQRQSLPWNELPALVPEEIKFLTLSGLWRYWKHPGDWHEVRDKLSLWRHAVGTYLAHESMVQDWQGDHSLTLGTDSTRLKITADGAARIPRNGGIELTTVKIIEQRESLRFEHKAKRAVMEADWDAKTKAFGIVITMYDVDTTDGTRTISRPKITLNTIPLSNKLTSKISKLDQNELMSMSKDLPRDDPRSRKRNAFIAKRTETTRRIAGTIHERVAFSVSVFVLVILGAALGIIFRGAHMLTSFGISFVPSLIVIVSIVMGKQMAQNETTYLTGLGVMWLGIVLVACVDLVAMTKLLRR